MNSAHTALAKKEFRALLPIWAATAGTIVADPFTRGTSLHALFPLGPFAYITGSLALGAHAIGHEYSNRTLGLLLAQPYRRSSILLIKAAVLALLLLAVMLLAWPLLFVAAGRIFSDVSPVTALLLPCAGALLVAPYLTMRLRSQIAGVVFTAAIPGTVWLLALLVGVALYGVRTNAAETFAATVWWPAMWITAGTGALLGTRTFLRLQEIEGGREELRLPRWLTTTDRNPIRPPLWMLVKKELRLQQMTFVMPSVFGAIWIALTMAGRLNPELGREFPVRAVALLYFALLPLLIGSLASAQERQFGTLDSQAMLPVSCTQQWAVKAGVVLALALVLGVLMPWVFFVPANAPKATFWLLTAGILFLTTWSLYLSSWSPSGIIALALVLPATAGAIVALRWVGSIVESAFGSGHGVVLTPAVDFMQQAVLVAPVAIALVFFAGRNHRSRERTIRQLAIQAACLLVVFAATDVVLTALL
jgi:hypothetical protein